MLIIMVLTVATILTLGSALRGGSAGLLAVTSFVWGLASYFALFLAWFGSERVFSGASLEAFGVVLLVAASACAAAFTSLVLVVLVRRRARAQVVS